MTIIEYSDENHLGLSDILKLWNGKTPKTFDEFIAGEKTPAYNIGDVLVRAGFDQVFVVCDYEPTQGRYELEVWKAGRQVSDFKAESDTGFIFENDGSVFISHIWDYAFTKLNFNPNSVPITTTTHNPASGKHYCTVPNLENGCQCCG